MLRPRQRPPIDFVKFSRLMTGRGVIRPSQASVRSYASHNDVGLNYLERGWMRVAMATGFRYELGPGQLSVFWGAVPHKIEEFDPGAILHGMVLPVGTFMQWVMPKGFTDQLLHGRVFVEPDQGEGPIDLAMFNRWHKHLAGRDAEGEKIVLLELEGRLRRLARSCPSRRRNPRLTPSKGGFQSDRMLLLVAEHFRERLLPRDVAAAVGLDPDYAGKLFRRDMGIALSDYITECRVSHAKALLATTDAKVLSVARDSGFGSVSQFHAVFKRLCGCTPRAFRVGLRLSRTKTPTPKRRA